MAMNPIPPQAYTKETLLKAYSWLMNQSPSIKEMATTPDVLVSLYLKATRDGDSVLDRPSIQNFKKELKTLAGLMGHLEKNQNAASLTSAPEQLSLEDSAHIQRSLDSSSVKAVTMAQEPVNKISVPIKEITIDDLLKTLDSESLNLLQSAKKELNLSNESEALRLLIKLGYSKAQHFLK